jgi:DNA-3-methyladenine glycosylase II
MPTTMDKTSVQLTATPPFDFTQSLDFIGEFPPMQGEHAIINQTLTRAIMAQGQPLGFQVSDNGTIDQPQPTCAIYSAAPLDAATQAATVDRISFHLSLADDLRPLYAAAESDPPFQAVVRRLYGLHQVKFPTPFENACWAVLPQRMAMPIARKMKAALIGAYGGTVEVDGRQFAVFPEAKQMSGDEAELERIIGNRQKAGYLAAVIAAFQQVDESWLRSGDYDEVATWLQNIRGIGAWSAKFVLIRGLGRLERILPDDPALLRAASSIYREAVIPARLAALAQHYDVMQGYWAYYLRTAE